MSIPSQYLVTKKINFITLIATIGGLCFGYNTGVMSGALMFMANDLHLDSIGQGLVTSSLLIGAAFGAISGGSLADKYGRRKSMLFVALLFFVSALATASSWDMLSMMVTRFILGFAVGCVSVIVPIYIAELAPINRRERLVTVNELMIVTGQFLGYAINATVVNVAPDLEGSWRVMLALPAIPGILFWLGMLFVPESPRFLVRVGMIDKAKKILQSLRTEDVTEEINEIQILSSSDNKVNLLEEIKKGWVLKLIFIGIMIALASRVTGVNTIMYYSPTVLKATGLGEAAAVTGAVANGVISILATFLGIYLIGKFARRKMFFTGQMGVILSLVLIGVVFTSCFHSELVNGVEVLSGNFAGASYIVLLLMLVFLVFMQGWIAPVLWLMLSEIYPLRIRGLAMGFVVFIFYIFDFIIQSVFPWLLSSFGGGLTFAIFAVANIIMLGVLYKVLPETKDLTLEQIEESFRS